MPDQVTLAKAALEAALRQASYSGLRDLHEALQIGQLIIHGKGKARLTAGSWGKLGDANGGGQSTACPLAALFSNDARAFDGDNGLAAEISCVLMAREGHQPEEFYRAWDAGLLDRVELREQVEAHLTGETAERAADRDAHQRRLGTIRELVLARRRRLAEHRARGLRLQESRGGTAPATT